MIQRTLAALTALLLTAAASAQDLTVEVHAGKHDRPASFATLVLPDALAKAETVMVMFGDPTRSSLPLSQRITVDGKPAVIWSLRPMKAGETASFSIRAAQAAGKGAPNQVGIEREDAKLTLSVRGKEVIRYQMAVVQPPDGVDKIFARSGYIHPVRSPSGIAITNDFPPKHLHHHGIWFPWTNTTYEGQTVDFWNSKKAEGKVEFVKLESTEAGDVLAGFRTHHKFVGMKIKGGTTILNETWEVRVYNATEQRLFDVESTQTCATDKPLTLLNYHYGGMGLRGSGQWEGKDVEFLCADGKTRLNGHSTNQKWVTMYGKIDGKPCGIAVLCHPSNFRAPQKTRIHPSEPFFNYSPCADGDFKIEPGKPYVSKYRYVTFDGAPDAKLLDQIWNDYAEPVQVKVK